MKGINQTTFPEGLGASNSGIGLLQLPQGHTLISSPNATIAAAGASAINAVRGECPKSVNIQGNWLEDSRFGQVKVR